MHWCRMLSRFIILVVALALVAQGGGLLASLGYGLGSVGVVSAGSMQRDSLASTSLHQRDPRNVDREKAEQIRQQVEKDKQAQQKAQQAKAEAEKRAKAESDRRAKDEAARRAKEDAERRRLADQQQQRKEEEQRRSAQLAEDARRQAEARRQQDEQQEQKRLDAEQRQRLQAEAAQRDAEARERGNAEARRQALEDEARQLRTEAENPDQPGLTDDQRQQAAASIQERVTGNVQHELITDEQRGRLRQEAARLAEQSNNPQLSEDERQRLGAEAQRVRSAAERPGQPDLTDEQRQALQSHLDRIKNETAANPIFDETQRDRLRAGADQFKEILAPGRALTDDDWQRIREADGKIREAWDSGRLSDDQKAALVDALEGLGLIVIRPPDGGGIIIGRPDPPSNSGTTPPIDITINVNDNRGGDNGDNDDEDKSDNDDNENGNGNDNESAVEPVAIEAPIPAPPAPAPDALSKCLNPGDQLTAVARVGTIIVTAFTPDLNVELTKIDRTSVPLLPVPLVDPVIFQVNANMCSTGAPLFELPSEVNLSIDYSPDLTLGADPSRFAIYYFDFAAAQWVPAPKLHTDPDNHHLAVSVTGLGVYAMVQLP